jgi:hypothetical protein
MALFQSSVCGQKISKFFVLQGRIHGRIRGCKWNLLKVREERYKGKHGEAQVEARSQEHVSALWVLLKPMITYGKGRTRLFSFNSQ